MGTSKVALYARVSTGTDEQAHALEQQLSRLRAAAGRHPRLEFVDVASGRKDTRPQLQKLLKACRSGQVDRVIVTRLDRMSRSLSHGAELLSYFSAIDTPSLLSLDDALDLETVGGRMVANILVAMAQAESERLSERVNFGKAYAREHLRPFGPNPPYGYRWNVERTNYELDPESSTYAREIVNHFVNTGQVRATLRFAWQQPGCSFTSTAGLMTWLLNPSLIGCRCYGRSEMVRDEQGRLRRRQRKLGIYGQIIPDCHEPLISVVDHAKVRAIYSQHCDRKRCQLQPRFARELTGLVVCGHCGHVMSYFRSCQKAPEDLRCNHAPCAMGYRNRIKVKVVEEAAWQKLRQNRDLIAFVHHSQTLMQQDGAGELAALVEGIKELEQRKDPDLKPAIDRKRKRLVALMQKREKECAMEMSPESVQVALGDDKWWELAKADRALTRRLFVELVDRVTVRDRKVKGVRLRAGAGKPLP